MNTNKNNWTLGIVVCLMLLASSSFTSCDDQLEIIPKGKTTLSNLNDLEALLNQEYMTNSVVQSDLGVICNESFGVFGSVPAQLSQPNTVEYANMAYDESVDRASVTNTDERYTNLYKYINYMNVVISKVPDTDGDAAKKEQLIAEARSIRAYFHWLLVCIYAKQYDEATAANEGGIAYVDNTNVGEVKEKLTLAEVYDRILEDCSDEVIAKLPQKNPNVERVDQAFGNAVRAKVLMQMKRYAEAIPYAEAALRINNAIEDRSTIVTSMSWDLPQTIENNLLFVGGSMRVSPTFEVLSRETSAMFEEGDYVINYDLFGGWQDAFEDSGVSGTLEYWGWSTNGNLYGVTTDRLYYNLAECLIRTGKIMEGLQMVDRVRAKRVENYEPFAQGSPSEKEAMAMLQKAKWIECIGTYENFFDCKRWNTEANYKRTITRDLGEYGTYSIRPESPLWVLPFPLNVTRYNPSMTQNY
ncbi:MAG: RagB/SusD family nutrient uptake outer membrane protein [Prevotella sp.]|nr:RagB/SusD family nutrient uptake outer membrane protein [Prevotella sp.]MBQ9222296.1 RagB/SusD family nutrient uptake outer membrane protein [Prevotella sp.]